MSNVAKSRARRLNIRLSQPEFEKIQDLSSGTTCRSVSEYARKVLLEKPVRVFYRNQSFDDFETRMTTLMPQLEQYGEAFGNLTKSISPNSNLQSLQSFFDQLTQAQKNYIAIVEQIRDHLENLSDHASQNNALP